MIPVPFRRPLVKRRIELLDNLFLQQTPSLKFPDKLLEHVYPGG